MSVVGAKIGTKTWSDAKPSDIQHSDGVNRNSATDLAKLGGEDVGDVLNKIADPNYVDPSKKTRAVGNDKLDKDAFMKLMLAQMKNQDPTNPLKSHEMAAQLAQFSGLEQMQNMNTTLTDIQKGQKPAGDFQALNFIGKAVAGDSAKLVRVKGDKEHEFAFALPEDAKDVELKVRNGEGEIIRKVSLHDLKKGDNKWTWNGHNETGNSVPTGEYQFLIEAKGSNGKKLFVKTDFAGMISGVNYTAEGPVLMVGSQTVKLKDVKQIIDPAILKGQKTASSAAPDLKNAAVASENEEKGAEDVAPQPANLMTGVGLSSGMMEKLKKETAPNAPQAAMKPEAHAEMRPEPKLVMKPETKAQSKADSSEDSGGKKATIKPPKTGRM